MTSQADQVAALNAVAMGDQSEWDEHGRLMFDMALKADERIAELERALSLCMIGGNHLPLIFGVDHPHAGTPPDVAREFFQGRTGWPANYEAWCCWDAIMRARDIRDQ